MITRLLYTVLLSFLAAYFISACVSYVYKAPGNYPTYPLGIQDSASELTAEQQSSLDKYNEDLQQYNDRSDRYYKNSFMIVVIFALLSAIAGLIIVKSIEEVGNGLLLGGIIALYGTEKIVSSAATQSGVTNLAVATIGLIVVLAAGFMRLDRAVEKGRA
ncbi:MAG: hypothetical protein WCT32_04230 [Patescibacteria group bacterium]|jgi:hypothetical protein